MPTYKLPSSVDWLSVADDGSRLAANSTVWDIRDYPHRILLNASTVQNHKERIAIWSNDELWAVQFADNRRRPITVERKHPETGQELMLPFLGKVGNRRQTENFSLCERAFARCNGRLFDLWDLSSGVAKLQMTCEGLDRTGYGFDPLTYQSLCFSPSGRYLAAGRGSLQLAPKHRSKEGKGPLVVVNQPVPFGGIHMWDVATGKLLYEVPIGQVQTLTFSADEKLLFTGADWQPLHVVDVSGGRDLGGWMPESANRSLAVSPNNDIFAAGGSDGTIRLWRVPRGRELDDWKLGYPYPEGIERRLREGRELGAWGAHGDSVTALAFHPNGRTLVSGCADGTLKLWNLQFIAEELKALGLEW